MPDPEPAADDAPPPVGGLFKRHPKLQIWLIAAVFYAILAGMVLFVMVLVVRG
jgi:hypothetical protein